MSDPELAWNRECEAAAERAGLRNELAAALACAAEAGAIVRLGGKDALSERVDWFREALAA